MVVVSMGLTDLLIGQNEPPSLKIKSGGTFLFSRIKPYSVHLWKIERNEISVRADENLGLTKILESVFEGELS